MKAWSLACAVVILSALANSQAQAQVDEGDLRLSFDLSLISFRMDRVKADSAAGDYVGKENELGLGTGMSAFGSGGIGIAYAASRHVLPGLYLSYQRVKLSSEVEVDDDSNDGPETTFSQLEIRPNVELTFVTNASFVPYGVVGFSYLRRDRSTDPGNETDHYGVGPVLGLGAHAFAARNVSFDFSLTFRALFIDNDARQDALENLGLDDIKQREYALMFNFGASLWL